MTYELTVLEHEMVVRALFEKSDHLHRAARLASMDERTLKLRFEADAYSDLAHKLKYS